MPAVYFEVTWPDGSKQTCYSPSTVIHQYFDGEQQFEFKQFMQLAEKALNHASERVEQRFGYACSSAMDQWAQISRYSQTYQNTEASTVSVRCPAKLTLGDQP